MNTVSLLGNVVMDKVMYSTGMRLGENNRIFRTETRVGGLANMFPALTGLKVFLTANVGETSPIPWTIHRDPNVSTKFSYSSGEQSNATIIVDGEKRTSFVEWNVGVDGRVLMPIESQWTHVAYLDVMENLDMQGIRKASGPEAIISGDLCLSDPEPAETERMIGYAEQVDVLFMSVDELVAHGKNIGLTTCGGTEEMMRELREITDVKILVCHSDGFSSAIRSNGENVRVATTVIRGVDTVGAGDLFTGFFIRSAVNGEWSVGNNLSFANENVGIILNRRNGG